MDFQFLKPKMTLKNKIKENEGNSICLENGSMFLYNFLVESDLLKEDEKIISKIQKKYEERLKKVEEEIAEMTNSQKNLKLANFYAETMNLEELENCVEEIFENSVKMDYFLYRLRIAFIFNSHYTNYLYNAEDIQNKCDWDRKNRFLVHSGLEALLENDFKRGFECFLQSLSTFNAEELMEYEDVGFYVIFCGIMSLPQHEYKKKIGSLTELIEIQNKIPNAFNLSKNYAESLYENIYEDLHNLCEEVNENDFIKKNKNKFENTVKFNLLEKVLESYSNVSLEKLSNIFKISEETVEGDLVNLIENRHLNFKIDGVKRIVKKIERSNKIEEMRLKLKI